MNQEEELRVHLKQKVAFFLLTGMLNTLCLVFLHRDLVSAGVVDNSVDSLCSCLEA